MDRQDIDALLIGALYGELTPADEARLTAHLESHPADRGALDDLKSARAAVRESRIFDLQLDPPQSVSALLLQEAHRRAPKRAAAPSDEKESWFYRFTRMFMAHPAMAAAAMLVLVVGVASIAYVKKGDQFVEKKAAQPTAQAVAPQDEPAANEASNEAPAAVAADQGVPAEGTAAGSGYSVQLHESAPKAEPPKNTTASLAKDRDGDERQQAKLKRQEVAKADANKKSSSMIVTTPQPEPKELDAAPAKKTATKPATKGAPQDKADMYRRADSVDDSENAIVGGAPSPSTGRAPGASSGRSGAGAGLAGAPAPSQAAPAAPSPPPPPVANAPTTTAKPAPAEERIEASPPPATNTTVMAWARGEHSKTVALANKGECTAAAKVALAVQNRVPDYYAQYMATDRALKKCQAYIAQEREAEAERNNRARAKRATSADQPTSK
jgi:hypothetical protein